MLNRKQYWYTLLVAIIIFFVFFGMMYFYTKEHSWHINEPSAESAQLEVSQVIPKTIQEIAILPQTKIILKMEDSRTHKQSQAYLSSESLLGITREQLEQQFEDYTIETFSADEVTLVKNYYSAEEVAVEEVTYVLGVEGDYVCIKEKDSSARPVKIDYEVSHFSKYMYSLLLNEEISITSAQKEALLLNPSVLQKILQGYVGD